MYNIINAMQFRRMNKSLQNNNYDTSNRTNITRIGFCVHALCLYAVFSIQGM